jgi:hypothetical protein
MLENGAIPTLAATRPINAGRVECRIDTAIKYETENET